ncbi:hypothetical protein PA598K_01867 [Paenibacillus sp. 598K]|uniref:GNAT family N-acetyltransferase n=1 Tax=Paenibacillus sp. 598K TaxID=1117987 RepID=UPI000FF93FF6|nr:GNAT family N-acetyltransferase [Paenibacillus sp. 598K]GBF73565.1 hypothetical protein PA598K_01867 [Paenibacillus sp. 598K]
MSEQYNISLINHSQISANLLEMIIRLKMESWNYSIGENQEWIKKNLKPFDKHLILCDQKGMVIAYSNLVLREIDVEGQSIDILGVGNLCVSNEMKRQGLGRFLMSFVNFYIIKNRMQGFLFCKDHLVSFYEQMGWKKLNSFFTFEMNNISHNVLVYNSFITDHESVDFKTGLF